MQDLNSGIYSFELEDFGSYRARRAFGISSAVCKYLGIVFLVLAACLFAYLTLLISFGLTGIFLIASAIVVDVLGGKKVYNYIYSYSKENFQILKRYRNGRSESILDTADKSYSILDYNAESGLYPDAVDCLPRDFKNEALMRYYICVEGDMKYLIATDNFMYALLKGRKI